MIKYEPYIEWDVVNWGRAPVFWQKHSALDWKGVKVLEIGGRFGGLSLWMARQGADVLCTDLEEIDENRLAVPGDITTGKLRYAQLDALNMTYVQKFDIILFKSVLGGIGRNHHPEKQKKAIAQIYRALKPGGELFFAENLTASPVHRFFRKKFVRWGREWRYITVGEMLDYLEPFAAVQYTTAGFLGAFGRTEGTRKMLGYMDRVTDRFLPVNWRYIMMGVAKK